MGEVNCSVRALFSKHCCSLVSYIVFFSFLPNSLIFPHRMGAFCVRFSPGLKQTNPPFRFPLCFKCKEKQFIWKQDWDSVHILPNSLSNIHPAWPDRDDIGGWVRLVVLWNFSIPVETLLSGVVQDFMAFIAIMARCQAISCPLHCVGHILTLLLILKASLV